MFWLTDFSFDAEIPLPPDALSTATYILGKDKGLKLIESIDGIEGIFVDNEGNITKTSGINESNFEVINN